MDQLKVGFARANITPMRGISVAGYFVPRYAKGVLDDLEVNVVALSHGEERALMITLDLLDCGRTDIMDRYRNDLAALTGVPADAIFVHCTHTHTGPQVNDEEVDVAVELVFEYQKFLYERIADTSLAAIEDMKPAKMGYAVGKAPNIAFIRRFRMKDGSVATNPGVNNPNIVAPIGEIDERVNVVRFDREGAPTVVLANFGVHPDTVGGELISGDWPGFFRRTLEKSIDNTRAIFFNGAQGDVNHVNVHPTKGDFNDMFMDFDDVSRGYGHARYMGRVIAGAVLQVYDKVTYTDVDSIRYATKTVNVPSNMPTPAEAVEAHRINDLHVAGKDSEIPYEGMMLTTVVAEAGRMVRLEHGPEHFPMSFMALSIGNIGFFGIPGEPFGDIGRGVKEAAGSDMVCPCCLVNGTEGYFPVTNAYEEGGYEARSSIFKAGVAELIIAEGKEMLGALKK